MSTARRHMLTVFPRGVVVAALLLSPISVGADIREGEESVHITIRTDDGRELPPEDVTRLRVFVHTEEERRPGHRSAAPVCQPTTNDAASIYGLTGWHLPSGSFSYRINTRRAPQAIVSSVASAIAAAAQTWTAADADKQLVFAGATDISRPRYDGNNVVLWKLLSGRTIAAAYVWYHPQTGEVLDADLVFNSRVPWAVNSSGNGDCGGSANAYDVQAVATHEFGHWFGLEDLYDASTLDLTMHGIVTVGELKKASLGEGDRLGANAVSP